MRINHRRALPGLVFVVAALAVWWHFTPGDTGSVLAELPPAPIAVARTIETPTATAALESPATPSTQLPPLLTPRSGEAPVAPIGMAPVRVRIPALGVDAPIVALGVDRDGRMEVPDDVSTVGWYRYGSSPGGPGSSVLAAHIDSEREGPGVFLRLGTLDQGDIIEVVDERGGVARFLVRAVQLIPKEELPLDRVFARTGAPVLTLITCGGGFSRAERSYDSNVVVVAVPVSDTDRDSGAAR